MKSPLSAFRLSNLLKVVEDVISYSRLPDSEHTTGNDAWLSSMRASVDSAFFACLHNSDMDEENLRRIKVDCTSLLNVVHANSWTPITEPYEVRRFFSYLPDIENALAKADEELERSARASFGIEETKVEMFSPEMSRPVRKLIVRNSLKIAETTLKKMIRNQELGLVNVPGTQMVRMLQAEYEKLFG